MKYQVLPSSHLQRVSTVSHHQLPHIFRHAMIKDANYASVDEDFADFVVLTHSKSDAAKTAILVSDEPHMSNAASFELSHKDNVSSSNERAERPDFYDDSDDSHLFFYRGATSSSTRVHAEQHLHTLNEIRKISGHILLSNDDIQNFDRVCKTNYESRLLVHGCSQP